jgi:hypothetical protein
VQADNIDGRRARVTIRQVAEQAGVSIATVSRVVNALAADRPWQFACSDSRTARAPLK